MDCPHAKNKTNEMAQSDVVFNAVNFISPWSLTLVRRTTVQDSDSLHDLDGTYTGAHRPLMPNSFCASRSKDNSATSATAISRLRFVSDLA